MKEKVKTFKKAGFLQKLTKKYDFSKFFAFEGRGNNLFLMKNGHYKIVQVKSIKYS